MSAWPGMADVPEKNDYSSKGEFHRKLVAVMHFVNSLGVCMFGFACCTLRSIQVAVRNWRRGYSTLERPDVVDA